MRLNSKKRVVTAALIGLLPLSLYANEIKITNKTLEAGVTSAFLSKSGIASNSDLSPTALYIEGKTTIEYQGYVPSLYLTLAKNGDYTQLSLRGGYEHCYAKNSYGTPYTSLSGGLIYHRYSSDPVAGAEIKDSSASSLVAVIEAGIKFDKGYYISTKLGLTNLETDIDVLGSKGSITQRGFLSIGAGVSF